jgi:hypothetical protein
MFLGIWRFITLIAVALLMGTTFAHVLEMPAKMKYDGALYVTLQDSLYVEWGPPNFGGILEPGSILATIVLAFLVRKERPAFWLTLTATVCLLLAFPVVFFWFVNPSNVAFRSSTPTSLPADWTGLRQSWEYGHATRFILHLVAFSGLVISALTESRRRYAGGNHNQ